jgi:hypothetical protein
VREAHKFRQPAHHGALEVNVGVIAGHDARVHCSRRQRSHDAGQGRRRVHPAEERRVAVAHGVRQDVARRRRDQLLQSGRLLRQLHVQKLVPQAIRHGLPDGLRGQRGQVIGDLVDHQVRCAAELLAHIDSIRSEWRANPLALDTSRKETGL